ncbi:MAG: archease [Nanoarchaeota archaeon]|nr:archease [Nanoarchaeota archaeon]
MKGFKFTEHTADMYIESWGNTLEEAFANAAMGLGFMIVVSDNVDPKIEKEIEVESEDLQSLLFDFLSQFLIFQDAEGLIFHKVKVEKIEEKDGKWHLKAKAWGEKFNPEKHEEGTHVKAITYHYMEIKKEKDKYNIKVLVDI